jgi:hypothetical protein
VSCSACLPGYVIVAATNEIPAYCTPCSTNCRTCTSSSSSSECTSCFSGYYLSDNTCLGCTNCLACEGSTKLSTCTACPSNSILRNNKSCDAISNAKEECGKLCASCIQASSGSFTCKVCAPGATMKSGSCINCPKNCAQCSLENLG